jgi:hypothetical protein
MTRRKETLADLTDNMRTALVHCASRGVLPTEFGDRWPNVTRQALVQHELIHLVRNRKGRELWRPTDTGRGLVAAHIPRLLAARPGRLHYKTLRPRPGKRKGRHAVDAGAIDNSDDYTHRPHEAMRHEAEAA